VTPGAFIEAAQEFGIPREVAMRNWDGCIQARAALYLPGGRIARELARNPTVLVVNDTAFAHGGLLPTHGEQQKDGDVQWAWAVDWAWRVPAATAAVASVAAGAAANELLDSWRSSWQSTVG
jgi:hypothetical protein